MTRMCKCQLLLDLFWWRINADVTRRRPTRPSHATVPRGRPQRRIPAIAPGESAARAGGRAGRTGGPSPPARLSLRPSVLPTDSIQTYRQSTVKSWLTHESIDGLVAPISHPLSSWCQLWPLVDLPHDDAPPRFKLLHWSSRKWVVVIL